MRPLVINKHFLFFSFFFKKNTLSFTCAWYLKVSFIQNTCQILFPWCVLHFEKQNSTPSATLISCFFKVMAGGRGGSRQDNPQDLSPDRIARLSAPGRSHEKLITSWERRHRLGGNAIALSELRLGELNIFHY